MAGVSFGPAVFAALVGVICVLVLAGLISTQLFTTAGRAKDHVANAARLRSSFGGGPPNGTTAIEERARSGNAVSPDNTSGNAFANDGGVGIADTLNQYYAANISQGQAIFWASLLSMVAGFVIIVVGIAIAGTNSTTAVVAGIAGVLSQFIAATFLVALRSTQEQSTTYAQSLADLRTRDLRAAADAQSVALGLRLLNEIAGDGAAALVNQTRAALAMALIAKESGVAPQSASAAPPPASVADAQASAPNAQPRVRAQSLTFDETLGAGEQRKPGR